MVLVPRVSIRPEGHHRIEGDPKDASDDQQQILVKNLYEDEFTLLFSSSSIISFSWEVFLIDSIPSPSDSAMTRESTK